tara:strand:+ start:1139 stop:1435 length:297 start_codon:yes stop_codon:yes gene_type:complete
MGMNIDEFYDMIPRHFWIKMDGFYELENLRNQDSWERTRWMTLCLLNIQLPRNKTLKPRDLIRFSWEKEKEIDIEKLKNRAEYYKNLDEHNLKNKNGE